MEPRGGAAPLPAWAACLPDPEAGTATHERLDGEWSQLEAAVEAMAGKSQQAGETAQREALLRVHQKLTELCGDDTSYGDAFEAYMLHAGGRCGSGRTGGASAVPGVRLHGGLQGSAAGVVPNALHLGLAGRGGGGSAGENGAWPRVTRNPACRSCTLLNQVGRGPWARGSRDGSAGSSSLRHQRAAGAGGACGAAQHAGPCRLGGSGGGVARTHPKAACPPGAVGCAPVQPPGLPCRLRARGPRYSCSCRRCRLWLVGVAPDAVRGSCRNALARP